MGRRNTIHAIIYKFAKRRNKGRAQRKKKKKKPASAKAGLYETAQTADLTII